MKEIEQSAGSADKEMDIIEQSFDYKINALKETWVGFLTEIADRGALASLIDALTKLSEVITSLLSQKGAITGLLSIITGALATKNNVGAVDIFDGIENGVNAAIDVAKNIPDIFDTFRASFTLGIKPEEIKDIRDAYNELKNGSDKTVDSFDNLSDKAKESLQAFLDLGNEGEDVDEVLDRMTDSSKAAAVAMDLLNTALISIVVFAVTKTFQSIVTYESELAEQATNATNALRNQQQTIDTYSTRIQALYDKINSGQLTLDEHVEANRELREIQRELVDNFGNEASGIDLVTSSLEKQRDVLKDVNNLKISQYLQSEFENEFNKETDSQKWLNGIFTSLVGAGSTLFGGITTTLFYDKLLQNYNETGNPFLSVQKYILGYENNLDEMESKFEDFSATISGTSDETLNKFIATYDNIHKLDNGDFEIFGNVNDVRDTIIHLQNDYKDMPGYTEKWANSLTQVWQKADDIYDKYGEIYNTRVEMAIASSDEYTAMQETLKSISDDYEKAVIEGDQTKVDELAQKYIDEVNRIRETVASKTYQDAIINIVPEIADPDIAKAKVKLDELVDYYNDPTNFDGSKYVKEWEDVINGLLTNPDLNFEEYASSFDEFISNVQAMIEDGRELELGSILGEINYEGYDYSLDDLKKLVNIYNGFVEEDLTDMMEKYGIEYIHLMSTLKNSTEPLDWEDLLNTPMLEQQLEIIAELLHISTEDLKQILIGQGLIESDTRREVTNQVENFLKQSFGDVELSEDDLFWQDILVKGLMNTWSEEDLNLLPFIWDYVQVPEGTVPTINYLVDALERYKKALEEINQEENPFSTISDSVKDYSTDIKPWIDDLGSAYDAIFNGDNGFDIEVVDDDLLNNIRSQFESIQQAFAENGIADAFDTQALEDFLAVLSDDATKAEEAQAAFNAYATSLFYSADGLKNLNEETANSIKQMLQKSGVENYEEVVENMLNYQKALEYIEETTLDLTKVDKEFIATMITKGEVSEGVGQKIAFLALQEQLANASSINTDASVEALYALADQAGIAGEYITRLEAIMKKFKAANAAYAKDTNTATHEMAKGIEQQAQLELNHLMDELELEINKPIEVKIPKADGTGGGSDAGKEEADEYLEAFNAELENLDWLREQGFIDEKEYLDQLRILYQRYFEGNDKYAKEFFENQRKYLEGLKDLYENALSAITGLLDDEIDKIDELEEKEKKEFEEQKKANDKKIKSIEKVNKGLDKQIKALEKEQKAIQKQNIDPIDEQIKGREEAKKVLEEELSIMQKANDERQDAIELQKLQYEMERAAHQKNLLVNTLCQPIQ